MARRVAVAVESLEAVAELQVALLLDILVLEVACYSERVSQVQRAMTGRVC